MKLNRCHVLGGLVGVVLGVVATLGLQAVFNNKTISSSNKISNFEIIESDQNGDVFITRYGKKYHNEWCPMIKSKQTQRVDSYDAEDIGFSPCKKCH